MVSLRARTVLAIAFGFAAQAANGQFCTSNAASAALLSTYPGAQSLCEPSSFGSGGTWSFFGVPMNEGPTPQAAADDWILLHAGAFGISTPDFRFVRETDVSFGRFTVRVYQQYVGFLPVDDNFVRVLVLNGSTHAVVYASARFLEPVPASPGALQDDTIDATAAIDTVKSDPQYRLLTIWTTPELVLIGSEGPLQTPQLIKVWKFSGGADSRDKAYTFYVDAVNGRLVKVRDDLIESATLTGTVSGIATPGVLPDTPTNPPTAALLPGARVRVFPFVEQTFADETGNYAFDLPDGSILTVQTDLNGEWTQVIDAAGCTLLEPITSVPVSIGNLDIVLNDGVFTICVGEPNEFTTAQVNAARHSALAHDMFSLYQPGFVAIDTQVPVTVNSDLTCNGRFDPVAVSIELGRSDPGVCVNASFSSLVTHEYGHYIVHRLELPQGSFGEGYSDTLAILMHDDPIIARDISGPGTYFRNIATAPHTYPCDFPSTHGCGQVLGRVWWNMRVEMNAILGDEKGSLDSVRELFTTWSLITGTPAPSFNSATPQTGIEILTADDTDGILANGTPNLCAILPSLEDRGIIVPVSFADCDGNGVPDQCDPDCDGDGIPDACETTGDSDGDGVPDFCDPCPLDNPDDTDLDGVCDSADICPGFNDALDADVDGVPDGCDICPGFDDALDTDGDGVPDGCDACPGFDDNADADADGVPDECDICPGSDDTLDTDGDGVPDGCDICAGFDDTVDTDGDSVPNGCDACPGFDDALDADADGVPDSCDACPGFDDTLDADGDGVPDGCDICAGGDDTIDGDGDGVPDFCDPCPLDNPDDTDSDGVCDSADACPGFDDALDADADGVPDGCDICPGFDDALDVDGDGVPNGCDVCPGFDDKADADADGVPDGCDTCPGFDDTIDADGDDVPDGCDVCPGFNDTLDADGDGVPNGCDICSGFDDALDADADGVPDGCDACVGFDDTLDADGDGVPDGCDICPGFDDTIDTDADRFPDGCDICAGFNDILDADADGVPDGCDVCPGFDDTIDADGDGIPDGCETRCNTDCECVAADQIANPSCFAQVCPVPDGVFTSSTCQEIPIRLGNIAPPYTGTVAIGDILCAAGGFVSYCACPNADIAGCQRSGVPITIDDILVVVAAFRGVDPCGCGVPMPTAQSGPSLSVGPPLFVAADRERASLIAVPRALESPDTRWIDVDVFVSGASELAGFEVSLHGADDESVRTSPTSIYVDTERSDYVFAGLESIEVTDIELGRVGGVALYAHADVTTKRRAYLGTFRFARTSDAKLPATYRFDLERTGLWDITIARQAADVSIESESARGSREDQDR
jgi:hypothetical protein